MLDYDRHIKLFLFPFAGGNMYSYRLLEKEFDHNIDTYPLELPGRGNRFAEPLLSDINDAVNDLFETIKPELEQPYAFFGHSLGSVLAYLVACRIRDNGYALPVHIFCSGRSGLWIEQPEHWYKLPADAFWEKISDLGGLPGSHISNNELKTLFEPILRSDFQLLQGVENELYHQSYMLDLPFTVFFGKQDKITTAPGWWHRNTKLPPRVIYFEGNHFYFLDKPTNLADCIQQILSEHAYS